MLLIDPFAGATPMAPPLTIALPDLAEWLVSAMPQQTRYDTRDILLAAYPDVYSRFMITALRENNVGDPALATAGMGAFIGFACDAFRRHDYLLGRKNCQDFLRSQLVLPEASPVFKGWAEAMPLGDYLVSDAAGNICRSSRSSADARAGGHRSLAARQARPRQLQRRHRSPLHPAHGTEFASGPLGNVLVWLAAKVGEGKVASLVTTAMAAALKQWNLA